MATVTMPKMVAVSFPITLPTGRVLPNDVIAPIRRETIPASELTRAAQILETAGVRLNKPVQAPYLTPRHEATLSLVLREAVTNIVRHAGASECSIEVSTAKDSTQLVIADDGRGDIRQEGNGLRGMRERVRELGGSLSLESHRGTRLRIELPQFSGNTEVVEP